MICWGAHISGAYPGIARGGPEGAQNVSTISGRRHAPLGVRAMGSWGMLPQFF